MINVGKSQNATGNKTLRKPNRVINFRNKTQRKPNRVINFNKLKKNKYNNDKFLFIGKYFRKEKNEKKETDKISKFELGSNKSKDSSFLGSYLNDSFYKELILNENFF